MLFRNLFEEQVVSRCTEVRPGEQVVVPVLIQGRVLGILVGQTSGAVKYLPSSSLWSTGGTTYTRCIQELGLDMPSSQYFTRG